MSEISFKEKRIRSIIQLYYSRPEIQKAIFDFSKNREISPRYFEGFGRRPDSLQYLGDIFQLVKKGATSFHCSEEIWEDPLKIQTGMNEKQLNELRTGWDLLIDIDCKWFDYSKKAAQAVINVFKQHGIENIGCKFSGSKGFHIILPWKAIPEKIGGEFSKNLFPELPRKIIAYIRHKAEQEMLKLLPENFYEEFKNAKVKKGIKCNKCREISEKYNVAVYLCPRCRRKEFRKVLSQDKKQYKCPECNKLYEIIKSEEIYECKKCNISSKENPDNFSQSIEIDLFEVLGLDLILVSPRHLFRMPYSLHEKTSLSSVVIDKNNVANFEIQNASPLNIQIKNFLPDAKENEANHLIREALDWTKNNEIQSGISKEKITGKYADFKPINLKKVTDSQFPPCVRNILKGVNDGKKRALFVLLNLFRSIGLPKEELEKKIYEWNNKNNPPLKQGYIKSQLIWSYRRKPIMPPNCREFYQGIGVCVPDNLCIKVKNPVNYVIKKNFSQNNTKFKKKK